MSSKAWERRDFIKSILAGIPLLSLDWDSFPRGKGGPREEPSEGASFDAVIIGAGLGGLSCGAAFARQGFKPIVLEQHVKPGGYATTFKRPGGFVFDASLHSTTVGERNGLANLIPGFPEISDVEFVLHPTLFRVIYPEHDFRIPQKNPQALIDTLAGYFPQEKDGIIGLFDDMRGLWADINRYSQAQGPVDMSTFPKDYPVLFRVFNKTWGQMVDSRLKEPKLKALVSWLCGYYGLPPSKLSSFYYALPTIGYLTEGGYYPRGRSQAISDALVKFITDRGGRVELGTPVERILTRDHAAVGVETKDGRLYSGRVVVSNASAPDTFRRMMPGEAEFLKDYLARLDGYAVSFSIFQVFLGLKTDLVGKSGLKDSEFAVETRYDPEKEFADMGTGDVETCGYGLTLYDNVLPGYSPRGKNTVTITVGQSYDYWLKHEAAYRQGRKENYRKDKERMADILVQRVEKTLLPGLRGAVEVREVATPLTNWRYTRNYRGAVYGWDQTLDNSGNRRLGHATPIKNLYLAGAWTRPGGGYGAVIPSGLECFAEIMKSW
jgi:all-trans-retinol 13,14-reductase